MLGGETPHQHKIDQKIKVTPNRLARHTQAFGQYGGVQETALRIGKHRLETAQSGCGNARSMGSYITLNIGAQEVFTPTEARAIIGGPETVRNRPVARVRSIGRGQLRATARVAFQCSGPDRQGILQTDARAHLMQNQGAGIDRSGNPFVVARLFACEGL